jgi:dTDP-4-amino-4,6-dideoxygalactose transaminase
LAGASGGLLVTNDKWLYERAVALRLEAEKAGAVASRTLAFWIWRRLRRYTLPFNVLLERLTGEGSESLHVNAPLANLDGAIALAQFESLERHAASRRRHARVLMERLSLLPARSITDFSSSGIPVKLVYVLPENGPSVEETIEILANYGIEAQGGYSPLHGSHSDDARLQKTSALWRRVLCVPLETRPRSSVRIPFQLPGQTSSGISMRAKAVAASI